MGMQSGTLTRCVEETSDTMSETSNSKLEMDNHRPIEGEEEGNISIENDSGEEVEEMLQQTKAARQRLRSEHRGVASMYNAMTGYSMTELLDADFQSLIDKIDALVASIMSLFVSWSRKRRQKR